MAMEYATITGKVRITGTTTGIPGELRATPLTAGGVLTFPDENITNIGPAVAEVADDGTLTPSLQIPTDVPEGLAWRLFFHPKGKGNLKVHLGDYPITASADLADLVPISGTVLGGFTDHGAISGTLEVTAGAHEMDLTGDLDVTVVGTGDVTLHVHGTGTLTVAGTDFDIDGDAVILIITSPRGVQTAYLAGGGTGEPVVPDSTPPSPITDLVATGGEETISANWSDQTDAETTVKYKYRIWLSSGGATGPWTTTTTSGFGPLEIEAGVYTVEAYAFSNGGASTIDTATATVTAPVVTPRSIKLGRNPLYYWPLDDAPGTTNPVNLGSGGGTAAKVGSVTFGASGFLGLSSCAEFSGGHITMPLAANLNGLSAFTVEFMLKEVNDQSGDMINGGGAYDDSYDVGNGYMIIEGDVKSHDGGTSSYTPGKLYGMTYDGTNMRFYSNGTKTKTAAHTGAISSSAAGKIGARGDGSNPYSGKLAEVVIYTTCLDDAAMLATAQAHGLA